MAVLRTLGLLLALTVATASSVRSTVTEWAKSQALGDPHATVQYERLAARVRQALPAATSLGYVTDGRAENIYKFQYFMAPVLLNPDGSGDIALGYFPAGLTNASLSLMATRGLRVKYELGDGVFILTR
jgi:hypothetical protein